MQSRRRVVRRHLRRACVICAVFAGLLAFPGIATAQDGQDEREAGAAAEEAAGEDVTPQPTEPVAPQPAEKTIPRDTATEEQKSAAASAQQTQPAAAPEQKQQSTAVPAQEQEGNDKPNQKNGWDIVKRILAARCNTAFCFANGGHENWLGIEPLVELPVGKSMALSNSALSDYVNNHDIQVDLAAGIRIWFFRDVFSLSVYLSRPLTDARVRLEGSDYVYPASAIRRPYPGIAVGLLWDTIWFGFDREELRNGDGEDSTSTNPDFPPNELISSAWTLTIALQPVTAFRTAIGAAAQPEK